MDVIIVTDATPDEIAALLGSMKKQQEITSPQTSSVLRTAAPHGTGPVTDRASHICGVAMGGEVQVSRG